MTHQAPDDTAVIAACDITDARTAGLPRVPAPTPDTLPAWLHHRFGTRGVYAQLWDDLDADDRSYWEHEAAAVRRAVGRNGFKSPNLPA